MNIKNCRSVFSFLFLLSFVCLMTSCVSTSSSKYTPQRDGSLIFTLIEDPASSMKLCWDMDVSGVVSVTETVEAEGDKISHNYKVYPLRNGEVTIVFDYVDPLDNDESEYETYIYKIAVNNNGATVISTSHKYSSKTVN